MNREGILRELGNVAASDAAHDFKKSARNPYFTFKTDIFKNYKKIGTPIDPGNEILDEWEIMFKILGLRTKAQQNAIFKLEENDVPDFRFYSEDTQGYHIRTTRVARKEGGAREWKMNGTDLVEWLKGDQAELILTIDAIDVPLNDAFEDPRAGAKIAVKYILTREGIVDGAMKANDSMTTTAGSRVQIQKIFDTRNENIAYFKTDVGRITNLAPSEYFFSNYTIHIPVVKTVKGIRSTTIEFMNKRLNTQRAKFKSVAEDKNPYTVTKLAKQIESMISELLGTTSRTLQEEYHMLIQSKRAGDWLQVLACLNPERFGLQTTARIRIATLDRICVLYALMMGVDVIYTRTLDNTDGTTDYFVTTFYRNTVQLNREEQVRYKIEDIMSRTPLPASAFGDKSYTDMATVYTSQLAASEAKLMEDLNEFETHIDELFSIYQEFKQANPDRENKVLKAFFDLIIQQNNPILQEYGVKTVSADTLIQLLLKLAIKIAILNVVIPPLNSLPAGWITKLTGEGLTEADISRINAYNENINKINILISDEGSEPIEAQINTKIKNMCYADQATRPLKVQKIVEDKLRIVDKLMIRDKSFAPTEFNENGIAVFSYINTVVSNGVKEALLRTLVKIRSFVGEAKELKKFDILLKLARMLIIEEAAPTIEEIPTEQILQSMFYKEVAHAEVLQGGGGGGGGGSAAAAAVAVDNRLVEISDFFPEQLILVERLRGGHNIKLAVPPTDILYEGGGGSGNKRSGNKRSGNKRSGSKRSEHNPLTTFCFILSHLNNALSAQYDDMEVFNRISTVVIRVINDSVKMAEELTSIVDLYRYLSTQETFLLEDLDQYMPDMGVRSFMTSVKQDFYGIDNISHYTPLAPAHAREYARLQTKMIPAEKQIDMNVLYLKFVIESVKNIESRFNQFYSQVSLSKIIGTIYRSVSKRSSRPTNSTRRRNASRSPNRKFSRTNTTRKLEFI